MKTAEVNWTNPRTQQQFFNKLLKVLGRYAKAYLKEELRRVGTELTSGMMVVY